MTKKTWTKVLKANKIIDLGEFEITDVDIDSNYMNKMIASRGLNPEDYDVEKGKNEIKYTMSVTTSKYGIQGIYADIPEQEIGVILYLEPIKDGVEEEQLEFNVLVHQTSQNVDSELGIESIMIYEDRTEIEY